MSGTSGGRGVWGWGAQSRGFARWLAAGWSPLISTLTSSVDPHAGALVAGTLSCPHPLTHPMPTHPPLPNPLPLPGMAPWWQPRSSRAPARSRWGTSGGRLRSCGGCTTPTRCRCGGEAQQGMEWLVMEWLGAWVGGRGGEIKGGQERGAGTHSPAAAPQGPTPARHALPSDTVPCSPSWGLRQEGALHPGR